ncbi:Uncharacterised protein [Klebsiella pneumoniae]|nr:Uncharacterised protein [Klebsiella pneumoniae]
MRLPALRGNRPQLNNSLIVLHQKRNFVALR